MRVSQIYAGFRLGILSYDVATYVYLFFGGASILVLSNLVSDLAFLFCQTMVTSSVQTAEEWHVKAWFHQGPS